MMEVQDPFADKVSRNLFIAKLQTENVGNLSGKDGYGDTARKSHDNRVGNKLDDGTQFENAQ